MRRPVMFYHHQGGPNCFTYTTCRDSNPCHCVVLHPTKLQGPSRNWLLLNVALTSWDNLEPLSDQNLRLRRFLPSYSSVHFQRQLKPKRRFPPKLIGHNFQNREFWISETESIFNCFNYRTTKHATTLSTLPVLSMLPTLTTLPVLPTLTSLTSSSTPGVAQTDWSVNFNLFTNLPSSLLNEVLWMSSLLALDLPSRERSP